MYSEEIIGSLANWKLLITLLTLTIIGIIHVDEFKANMHGSNYYLISIFSFNFEFAKRIKIRKENLLFCVEFN